MSRGKCRGCSAQVLWVEMESGKKMPCDPQMITYWAKDGAPGKIVTPNGEVVSCEFEGDPATATGIGYISHFSTCSQARELRRKRSSPARAGGTSV